MVVTRWIVAFVHCVNGKVLKQMGAVIQVSNANPSVIICRAVP